MKDSVTKIFADPTTQGILISLALDFIPGWDLVELASLIIDLVDPYGYNSTLSRDSLNEITSNYFDSINSNFSDQNIIIKFNNTIKNVLKEKGYTDEILTDEFLDKIRKKLLNYWKVVYPDLKIKEDCYENIQNKSGKPKDTCNLDYIKYYNEYYNEHVNEYNDSIIQQRKDSYENLVTGTTTDSLNKKFLILKISMLVLVIFIFIFCILSIVYDKKFLILICIFLIAFIFTIFIFKNFNDTKKKLEETHKLFEFDKITPDYLLDGDSHNNAEKNICINSGYNYDETSKMCVYTKESCNSNSNKNYDINSNDDEQEPYLEWHEMTDGTGRCLNTYNLISNYCSENNFPYYQGEADCDESDICKLKTNPTCKLTEDYCLSKGVDYNESNGLGDCTSTDVQKMLEIVLGTTITRKWKESFNNTIDKCNNQDMNECALASLMFFGTGGRIVFDTTKAYGLEAYNNIKDKCSGISNADSTVDCLEEIRKSMPDYYIGTKMAKMVDSMFGMIPGFPKDLHLVEGATELILLANTKAIKAFIKVCEDPLSAPSLVVDAFLNAKHLSDTALDQMINYGSSAANVIKSFGIPGVNKITDIAANNIVNIGNIVRDIGNIRNISDIGNTVIDIGNAVNPANFFISEKKSKRDIILSMIKEKNKTI